MEVGLISLSTVQIARMLGLVRAVEVVRLDEQPRPAWTLLVRGRGFTRILRDEPLISPNLLRTVDPTIPRPMEFLTHPDAVAYARSIGLIAKRTTWHVSKEPTDVARKSADGKPT